MSATDAMPVPRRRGRLVVISATIRGILLLLALVVAAAEGAPSAITLLALVAIAAFGMSGLLVPSHSYRLVVPLVEGALVGLLLTSTAPFPFAIAPYLVVPPLVAGIQRGYLAASLASTAETCAVILGQYVFGNRISRSETATVLEWLLISLSVGVLAAWTATAMRGGQTRTDTYAAAHRLLLRLREVARQLPTGLDEVSLAQQVLNEANDLAAFDRGALYAGTDGALAPLAVRGDDRPAWQPELDAAPWSRAWHGRRASTSPAPLSDPRTFPPGQGTALVVPMRLGERCVGLLALERGGPTWSRGEIRAVQESADDGALRIASGQLFSEVRALATVEERRRLAREIHDGIAQDIASVGYIVDDLAARSPDPEARADLNRIRTELTRMVTELRLSIFDLRSDVQPSTGLGAALTSYVRQVGADSGLTVHLVLDESQQRLPIEAEAELLRIAQEAVANARKHAHAHNMWVTCRVDPPRAFLRVADDGLGLGAPRSNSYGLEIMRERATRLGATLAVRQRVGGGTVVEVGLGGAAPSTRTQQGGS